MLHISYLYRIHTVTFLPFRAYNTDNQLIINTFHKRTSVVIEKGKNPINPVRNNIIARSFILFFNMSNNSLYFIIHPCKKIQETGYLISPSFFPIFIINISKSF